MAKGEPQSFTETCYYLWFYQRTGNSTRKTKPVPRPRTRQQKSVAAQPSTSYDSTDDSTDESEVEYVLRPVDSESTLTEISDGSAHDISILSGDAHHEDIQGKEMEIGSASDTAEVEDETPQDTELKTPVPV